MVFFAEWLVRILLILVDCLPILTKKIAGATTYNSLISRQLTTDEELHGASDDLNKQRDLYAKRVESKQLEYGLRNRLQLIEERDEADRSQREAELNSRVDALAAELLRSRGSGP
jgi:hypothetical protein